MRVTLLALASVALVSLASLAGLVTLAWGKARAERVAGAVVPFAVGALLGDAFLHLLPEAFAAERPALETGALAVGGIVGLFLLETILRARRAEDDVRAPAADAPAGGAPAGLLGATAVLNVVADGLHNFADGLLIGASYVASVPLGVSTTVAVLLHELPQELGDFGILVASGLSVRRALLVNLATALVALLGAALALVIGARGPGLVSLLVPVTAGAFVYLAAAVLVPALHRQASTARRAAAQVALLLGGVAVMALLARLE